MADLDKDGHIDLVSGSWPGEIFLFRGKPGHTFAKREMIPGHDGHPLNIGARVKRQNDGAILITGHVEWAETEEGSAATFRGKQYTGEIWTTGCASAVHACDWDSDGDIDLLIGEIGGRVYLVPNVGTAETPRYGKHVPLLAGVLQPIQVPGGDAGPFVADWDGDGDHDLLVGCGDGSVVLYRNSAGKGKLPALAAREQLVAPGVTAYGDDVPKDVRRGHRAKICVADWNGDGRLDLLLGDFTTQKPDRPEPTAEEKAIHDLKRAEIEKLHEKFGALSDQVQKTKDKAERDKLLDQFPALEERMRKLRSEIPTEYENHGWVWLFLRKAPSEG